MAARSRGLAAQVKGRSRLDAAVADEDFHVIIWFSNLRFMGTSMI